MRLEALADGEPGCQVLVLVFSHNQVRCILGEHAGSELLSVDVVLLYCLWVFEFFNRGCHQGGPFAVKVNEVLRRWLTRTVVGAQQCFWCTASENVAELPRNVETMLNGDVHALAGLGRVGVAGSAS